MKSYSPLLVFRAMQLYFLQLLHLFYNYFYTIYFIALLTKTQMQGIVSKMHYFMYKYIYLFLCDEIIIFVKIRNTVILHLNGVIKRSFSMHVFNKSI